MKLEALLLGLEEPPVTRHKYWIYLEQNVNVGNRRWDEHAGIPEAYAPRGGTRHLVPFAEVPLDQLTIFQANPDPRLEANVYSPEGGRFFWHPAVPTAVTELGVAGELGMVPTSSTRSLLRVDSSFPFVAKTDLNVPHYRYSRELNGGMTAHSVAVSGDIEAALQYEGSRFGFLPESLGFVYGDPKTGTSVLFREVTPRPFVDQPRQILPAFSLHSPDLEAPNDPPLLIQIIEWFGKSNPLGYFVEQIIGLVQDLWILLGDFRGLLLEAHGQNTCFELDERGLRRVIPRDYQGICWNPEVRQSQGLQPFAQRSLGEPGLVLEQEYSLCYDHYVGRYLFWELVQTFVAGFPRYSHEQVAAAIGSRFRSTAKNLTDLFPARTTYRLDRSGGVGAPTRTLLDTHTPPLFR